MAPSDFADPTTEFLSITMTAGGSGGAQVEGVVAIPGLPTCHVRLATDADRVARYGPGRRALLDYVRAALCADVVEGLPWN